MRSHIYNPQPNELIERLELELTSICNLKCPLCIREVVGVPKTEPYRAVDDIIYQLDQYPSLKYVTIAGAISEPTSHPNLFDIIIYLRKRDIEISLYINGDTKTDVYYVKLGLIFRECKGHIYFTICGSTQELHSEYRVNSQLSRVLTRLDLINRYSKDKGILTWIVFNYNEQDFLDNYQEYKSRYNTEYFYTLPMAEHFCLTDSNIRLPDRLHEIYITKINRTDFTSVVCPANKNKFVQIDHLGDVYPCTLYKLYGEKHCFECSGKNLAVLRKNKIFNVAEPESEESEKGLRLFYDNR